MVILWDTVTGRVSRRIDCGFVGPGAVAPVGDLLAVADCDLVRLWNWKTGQLIDEFHAHWNGVWSIAFSPDGSTLATGGWTGDAKLWNVKARQADKTETADRSVLPETTFFLLLQRQLAPHIAFSPRLDTRFAVGALLKDVQVWNPRDWRTTNHFRPTAAYVLGLGYFADGSLVTANSLEKSWDSKAELRIWKPDNCDFASSLPLPGSPDELVPCPRNRQLVIPRWASDLSSAALVDVDQQKWRNVPLVCNGQECGEHWSAAWSADGSLLAVGTKNGFVTIWDPATLVPKAKPLSHGVARIGDVAFSPDGTLLGTASGDSTVKLWDVSNLQAIREVAVLDGHSQPVSALDFSPDGTLLVTAGGDYDESDPLKLRGIGEVRLWNVASRQPLAAFAGHAGRVAYAGFSPDGKLLATSGRDYKAHLWDVGKLLEWGKGQGKSERLAGPPPAGPN